MGRSPHPPRTLKLGMDVGQTTVAKYMAKRRRPPSQGWRTFVHNHADAIASIDMFVVPTISFGLLYGLLILRQSRRELLWLGVTAPSQCGMACPPDDRGLGLGRASTLLGPRPRRRVWRCLHPAHPGHGIRDRPVSGAVALAERICGEADRLDPTGGDTDQRSHGATADRGGNGAKPAEFGKMVKIAGGGVERWVGLGVIADNLINIGRKRQGSLNKPLAIIGFQPAGHLPGVLLAGRP